MTVRLETRDGGLVAQLDNLPAFQVPPEIIVWGLRHFVLWKREAPELWLYREAFAYYVPPGGSA